MTRCGGVGRCVGVFGLAVLLLSAGVVPELAAQEEQTGEGDVLRNRVFQLGEIEVVGKEEESRNKTIDKVYDEEMRLFDRNDLADAVNLLPGVTLSEMGRRNETMIYVRGFDIKHVPMFLDGIPIYVPYDGYPDLSRFNTFDLSEVIVSKGFTSVLYGPNTMGGAINMVSRRPVKEFEMNAEAGYASGDTYHSFANFGSNQGKWYIQGGGAYLDRDHFRVSHHFHPTGAQGDGERVNSYREDWKVNLKVGLTPNETDEYAVSYINQQAEKGSPPYAGESSTEWPKWWQWPYWNKESVYFNSTTSICDKSYVKIRLYYDIFENSLYSYDDETYSTMNDPKNAFKSWYDDYTYGGSVEAGTQLLTRNFIKTSFHYKDDVHREHDKGEPIQRSEDRIYSIGLEDTIDITDRIYTILGISYDRLEPQKAVEWLKKTETMQHFEIEDTDALNPQCGLFYKLTDSGVIHASVARKTRLPSMKDKYSYKLGKGLPNPDLEPEESLNYELGYKDLLLKKFTVEANVFYSDVKDFIISKTVPDPDNPGKTLYRNENIGDVKQYGVEVGVSGQILNCLKGGFNYTYIQYLNKSSSDKITNIPHNKAFTYLQYFTPLDGLSLLGSLEYNSDRFSSTDALRVAGEYILLNAKAIYELPKGFTIEGGINNIADEDYAIDEGYPLEGRNLFANVRYKF
ncbi:MAG: TonB-dependent receptor plug domain-containing protein [Syntrophobacteraceae bacterium]